MTMKMYVTALLAKKKRSSRYLLSHISGKSPANWPLLADSPDNLHGVVVLLVVDAHDKHGSISTGGGDHHPLGAALQVSLQGREREP